MSSHIQISISDNPDVSDATVISRLILTIIEFKLNLLKSSYLDFVISSHVKFQIKEIQRCKKDEFTCWRVAARHGVSRRLTARPRLLTGVHLRIDRMLLPAACDTCSDCL